MDSARVVEINKDSPGIRLSYPGQPPQMQQLLNRLQNARLFAKNDTPEWFWAHLNLALRTTIKKQRFEFHWPKHIAIKQLVRSFYKELPKASRIFFKKGSVSHTLKKAHEVVDPLPSSVSALVPRSNKQVKRTIWTAMAKHKNKK